MSKSWELTGTYFESCNCDAACPCVFLSDPTEGDCTVLLAWHIDRGHFAETSLDGLNAAAAIYSPGNMVEVPWQAALYFDDQADDSQMEALGSIFSGQAGGHPARLADHIGEVLGVRQLPIEYQAKDGERRVRVGDIGGMTIQRIQGQGGGQVQIEGHPLAIAPGQPAVVSRSDQLRYEDHGFSWSLSGKTGFYSPFRYAAE